MAQQANFEKAVYAKTSRTNARGEGETGGLAAALQRCPGRRRGLDG